MALSGDVALPRRHDNHVAVLTQCRLPPPSPFSYFDIDCDGTAPPPVLPLYPLSDTMMAMAHSEAFDHMLYEKGASLNRMVHDFMGPLLWHQSLSAHLQRFAWQNPTLEDLLASWSGAFAAAGGVQAAPAALRPWFTEPGFPVVTLSLNSTAGRVTIVQEPVASRVNQSAAAPRWVPVQLCAGTDEQLIQLTTR